MNETDEEQQPPGIDGTGPSTLTPQERDVLAISATGRTSAEVASIIGCSHDVARHTIAGAILKLGARSKLEAIILALRQGLIKPPVD